MLDHSKSSLLHELEQAGATIKADGREILCPFHDDKHASGGIYEGDDGIWRYKCHAASCGFHGDAFDVLARSENRPLKDVLTENNPTSIASLRARRDAAEKAPPKAYPSIDAIVAMVPGELEARYTYMNPTTKDADLVVLRYRKDGKKHFWQVSRNHAGWVLQRPEGLLPLYNRTQVSGADKVIVCYSSDTEVLTHAGWKLFSDLKPFDEVAEYWPDGERVDFVTPSGTQRVDYTGPMVNIKSDWCDLLVTPDHRVLWRRQRCRARVSVASDIGPNIQLPVSGTMAGGECYLTEVQVRLLAAFANDGNLPSRTHEIAWRLKKWRKIDRLRGHLSAIGTAWTEHMYMSTPGWTELRVRQEDAPFLLSTFPKKAINRKILSWSAPLRRAFLDELRYWDGDSVGQRGIRFFTAKREEAEVVSEAAVLSGLGVSSRYDGRRGGHNWIVSLNDRTWRTVTRKPTHTDDEYHGEVFCCSVPSGFLVVRRNGKAIICGNCEGEKCVHALRSCNHVGTTSPMGAGKAKYADWSPLAGKTVYLWPDNDCGGLDHMRDVAAICDRLNPPACVYWIEPAGLNLPEKGDVADFIEGKTPELARAAVAAVLDTATALGAARELEEMMEATIDGRRAAVSWPWESVTSMTKALLPGTVTLFCGAPGTSKSFAILQVLRHWYALGVPAVVFELEEDRAYHLNRLLAQECGNAGLVDPDWVREHGAEVRAELQKHRALLNAIGRMIYAAPQEQIDYRKVVEWTQARANEGFRLIVIDPVTAVSPQRDVWVADSEFMFRIKTIAREKGCSIVLVTHPRKGVKKSCCMDDLAGGAAFQRFSQTLLWLEAFKDPKSFVMRGVCGRFTGKCNRALHLMKCRNGGGTNGMIGMMWRGNDLCLAEQGIVVSESRQKKGEPPTDEGDPWSPEPGDKEPDDRWHF